MIHAAMRRKPHICWLKQPRKKNGTDELGCCCTFSFFTIHALKKKDINVPPLLIQQFPKHNVVYPVLRLTHRPTQTLFGLQLCWCCLFYKLNKVLKNNTFGKSFFYSFVLTFAFFQTYSLIILVNETNSKLVFQQQQTLWPF